jgi:hypothetical protein
MLILRPIKQIVSAIVLCVAAGVFISCGNTTTVTPLIKAGDTLAKPDRLLVYDFEVAPGKMDFERGPASAISPAVNSDAQTDEETRIGKAMAKALTDGLLRELRSRGIANAYRATESSPPGEDTASIKGRFLRQTQGDRTGAGFSLGSGQVRTHIWMFQGTGLALRLVAESETATPSELKRGIGVANAGDASASVGADAARIAKEVADRIVEYGKRRGWMD